MTTREVRGEALYEFLLTDGHRIPTALRSNLGNIHNAVQRMCVVIKCTRKNDKGKDVDDVVSATYDGHTCSEVRSAKRIFAFARDSNGVPMTADEVTALVDRLKSIDWYSVKKPIPISISKKRQFGQLVSASYHGKLDDKLDSFTGDDLIIARTSIKAGKISQELGIPCVFNEDGSDAGDGDIMKIMTSDETAIYEADCVKLRKLVQYVGRILNYKENL